MKLKKFSIGQLFAKLGFHPTFWENVSNEPSFDHLIGKEYETLQPLFFVNMAGIYCLEPPGRFEGVPASVEDYYNHPKDWWTTEAYKKAIEPLTPDPRRLHTIIDVLPAGTRLKILKITYKKGGMFGGRLTVLACLQDPRYSKHQVCCGTVMRCLVGQEPSPQPKMELIKPV